MSDQAHRTEIADLASRFVAARQSGVKIEEASLPWRPATFEEAIAVQDATLAKLTGELGGYKIFKVDGKPGLLGPIRKVDILASGAPVRSPMPRLGFECEIAFKFARTLAAPKDGKEYSRGEVAEAVACALAIIEVVETRFTDYPTDPNMIVADCFNSGRFVIGTEIPDWQARDLSGALAEILIDGEVKVSKTGGHGNAHPFDSAALVRHRAVAQGPAAAAGVHRHHRLLHRQYPRRAGRQGRNPLPRHRRRADGLRRSLTRGEFGDRDANPPVLAALVLDLDDRERPPLTGGGEVRAAAGLAVEAFDVDDAHRAVAERRRPPPALERNRPGSASAALRSR